MLEKTYVKSRKVWKVKFKLPKEECPAIKEITNVQLVGDFNNWDPSAMPMIIKQNAYTATIELQPGYDYHFRYLINGKIWWNDGHADKYFPNNYGGENCVVILPKGKASKAAK